MAGKNVVVLTDGNFDAEVLGADLPVLVDFFADWCAPCRMMGPVIDEVADEYAGKVKVGKLDTDAHRDSPSRFGVTGLPTLVIFKGGEVAKRFVGVTSKSDLKKALDTASA